MTELFILKKLPLRGTLDFYAKLHIALKPHNQKFLNQVLGKNMCVQITKNNALKNSQTTQNFIYDTHIFIYNTQIFTRSTHILSSNHTNNFFTVFSICVVSVKICVE